jgi:hypothetical protein
MKPPLETRQTEDLPKAAADRIHCFLTTAVIWLR